MIGPSQVSQCFPVQSPWGRDDVDCCALDKVTVIGSPCSGEAFQGERWQAGTCLPRPSLAVLLSALRSHGIARALHLSHTSPLFLLFSIRWQQTSKSSGLSSGLQPAGAKADALREEMEEAANRVEICRVPLPPPSLLLLTGTDGTTLRESLFPPLALY